jgi:subfamily B ATP-binding cassette protein MsbA
VESGRILERGTHGSLYAARGRYYDLYTKQHGVEMNLFLAPGEGDETPKEIGRPEPKRTAAGVSDALRLL